MKKTPKLLQRSLILFLMVFLTSGLFSQVRLSTDGAYINAELTEEEKEEILLATESIITEYATKGSFLDENGTFSDEAYANFLSIFASNAEVFNDLVKKDGGNINFSSYADNVFQYMQSTGVKFELSEIYLDQITYDSSGFYIVQASLQKTMFNGLDDNNQVVSFPNNGRTSALEMLIEIPEYDLSQASILGLKGEAKKEKIASANIISVNGNYHLGNISKTVSDNLVGYETGDFKTDYNSYGVDVAFRRSVNYKKSIYLLLGASLQFHNFKTDLSNFNGSSASEIDALAGGAALDPFTQDLASFTVASNRTLETNRISEELQVIDIQVPIGVSLRLVETYNWDVFLDVAVVPTYIISSSGSFIGDADFTNLPQDNSLFPEKFENFIKENNVSPYINNGVDYSQELVEADNMFSASAQITPMVHYKFNFNMAFEFGANISYGFLPYFANESNHLENRPQYNLINISDDSFSTNPTVLQNSYKNVGIFRYGLRAGIVFKL